jgi:hypothetical protein
LKKGENGTFKLNVKRSDGEDLKIVTLFDALDKMDEYDEAALLKKNKSISKQQLSNLKGSLYRQILASLRHAKDEQNIDIQLNEQMGYARILYNKGLYHQSLKVLNRIKQSAQAAHQLTFQMQAIFFEKKIESLHITRSMENRAEALAHESEEITLHLSLLNKLSNLSLQLYSWYIKMGHARDEKDVAAVKMFFETNMPVYNTFQIGFYGKMYLYQSYCWYNFILQDLLMYYRYAQKWVDLFNNYPEMVAIETVQYIKAIHNLLSAHFDLNNYARFAATLEQFEQFAETPEAEGNANNRIQIFVYLNIARINKHFLNGTFTEGLHLVPPNRRKTGGV